jgi:hypothetical protein
MADGISATGRTAEAEFCRLTGFSICHDRGRGDALATVDGIPTPVEVKKCSASTINQVRPIKFLPLVIYNEANRCWYVIGPVPLIKYACGRGRGQHTEIPFESVTLNINAWELYKVGPESLKSRVVEVIRESRRHCGIELCMRKLAQDIKDLSDRYKDAIRKVCSL